MLSRLKRPSGLLFLFFVVLSASIVFLSVRRLQGEDSGVSGGSESSTTIVTGTDDKCKEPGTEISSEECITTHPPHVPDPPVSVEELVRSCQTAPRSNPKGGVYCVGETIPFSINDGSGKDEAGEHTRIFSPCTICGYTPPSVPVPHVVEHFPPSFGWAITGCGDPVSGDGETTSFTPTQPSPSINGSHIAFTLKDGLPSCDKGCTLSINSTYFTDFTVVMVDIIDPAENDVHLKGEEVKFDGKVTPTGVNGVTYAWSVLEGACEPGTASTEDFQTVIKSEGTIKVKLIVTIGGSKCEKIRTITAVVPEVTKLSWTNDHAMTKWDGGAISDPVWVKALGGAVTKNEPGTYTKDSAATAELEIQDDLSLTHSTSIQVKGNGNKESFYPIGATFHNWTWTSGELQLDSSPLYASVNFYDTLDVTWCYRVQKLAGGWGEWVEMNESQHLLYTVDATPAASPLYDRGVDKACRYANGAANFASAINIGFASYAYYDPSAETSHDLHFFDYGYGQCCCHAAVFSLLIAHVTSTQPTPTYAWGGCSSSTRCNFKMYGTGPDWWHGPSFQCQRPATDGSTETNPHFTFHVEVPLNEVVYDPAYGLTGWASFLETAPAVTNSHPTAACFQSGSSMPSAVHKVDWVCGPH